MHFTISVVDAGNMSPSRKRTTSFVYRPIVYFVCDDLSREEQRCGQILRQVEVLREAEVDARVVDAEGMHFTEIVARTPDAMARKPLAQSIRPCYDILVIPARFSSKIPAFPGPKVIFHDDSSLASTTGLLDFGSPDPYLSTSVIGLLTTSHHCEEVLRAAYPMKPVHVIPAEFLRIDQHWAQGVQKRAQIVVSDKGKDSQAPTLLRVLRARSLQGLNRLAKFEWLLTQSLPRDSLGSILLQSLVFIHLDTEDDVPESTLQALGSGCLCVMYGYAALLEFYQGSTVFEYGQLTDIVRFLESALGAYPEHWDRYQAIIVEQQKVLALRSRKRQAAAIVDAWKKLIHKADTYLDTISP